MKITFNPALINICYKFKTLKSKKRKGMNMNMNKQNGINMDRKKLISLFVLILFIGITNANAFEVSLDVKERYGIGRISEPVTYGVPFSKSDNIKSISQLAIFDKNGVKLPAQFRVLSRYNGTASDSTEPIRVVLVDFQANVSSFQKSTYFLKSVSNGGTSQGTNIASEDTNHITISTGKLIIKIRKNNFFNIFDEVYIDKDNDGNVNDQIVSSNSMDGIVVNYMGKDYTSYYSAPMEVIIEENGPLRAVVKVKGLYKDSSGKLLLPPLGDVGLGYTIRFKAYKDKPYVKVDYTLGSENFGWTYLSAYPAHHIYLNAVSLKTTINLNSSKTIEFENFKENFSTGNYILLQDHKDNTVDESSNFVYSIKKNGNLANSGQARLKGLVDLRDSQKGIMVATRWWWQNWPKAVEINNNVMEVFLWPNMNDDHKFLGGTYKTHELIYNFHSALSQNYSFDSELATLKKRLIARASDTYYASTNFLGFMPPANIDTSYSFPKGESLKVAIEKYNKNIRAKYNASYSNGNQKATITSLRENRPFTWSKGPLINKRINWYGWLDFGDMARGGTYGFPALHYSWDYISLLHSLRFDDYDMFDIGEEMVSHKVDIDIIHDPTGIDDAGSWDEDYYHGGGRYETDAHMQIGDTFASAATSGPRGSSHFWIKGVVLHYLMTGNERYYDVLSQIGDHFLYSFSTGKGNSISCDNENCWGVETRHQSRAINNLVNLWKLKGNQVYLNVANDIFVNGLLSKEANSAGYYDYNAGAARDWCGGDKCDSHNFYESITIEPLITLYYALEENGQQSNADSVFNFLKRHAIWMKNIIYKNYQEAICGTYSGDKYFPYSTKIDWENGYKWPVGQGHNDISYSFPFADNFAFLYRETGEILWLNVARAVFKDGLMYKGGTFENINFNTNVSVNGFGSNPGSAYLKVGKKFTKPMIYLYTEWIESKNGTPPPTDTTPPDPPQGLRVAE